MFGPEPQPKTEQCDMLDIQVTGVFSHNHSETLPFKNKILQEKNGSMLFLAFKFLHKT